MTRQTLRNLLQLHNENGLVSAFKDYVISTHISCITQHSLRNILLTTRNSNWLQ